MVVANMIGTGIFTSIGFQVMAPPFGIPDAFSILFIWFIGGVLAICGAMSYAEVSTTIRQSGGEYTFLSKIYHPIVGFTSGWVSMVVGFSAAVAALAIAAADYLNPLFLYLFDLESTGIIKPTAIGMILLVTVIQLSGTKYGGTFQNIITYFKVVLIAFFILIPFLFSESSQLSGVSFSPTDNSWNTIFSLPFAGCLVYVMFSYSGWNASSYIVGNLQNPRKDLPFSLITGTFVVMLIYVLLNFVFLYTCSMEELEGKTGIGNIVIGKILGKPWEQIFSGLFAISFMAGINAMFIAGPRVTEQIGRDYRLFSVFNKQNKNEVPIYAILLQTTISISIVLLMNFQTILQYIELTLSLFCLLTVIGVFVLRAKKMGTGETVKTWGYPVTPLLFILITVWMMAFFIINEPIRLLWTFLTILSGVGLYFAAKRFQK